MTRIEEIEAREKAASPGPWIVAHTKSGDVVRKKSDYADSDSLDVLQIEHGNGVWFCDDADDDCWQLREVWERDIEFAANAREDIPYLLSEVKRLRERVRGLEAGRTTK